MVQHGRLRLLALQLDHEDLEQLDKFDLEEMDLKWQVAMISMRMKKFYKKTGRKLQFDAKEPVGFDKTKVECYNCHKTRHFARECRTKGNQDSKEEDAGKNSPRNKDGRRSGKQEDSKALVTINGEGVGWTSHPEEEADYALMACNSSGSDTEISFFSKEIYDGILSYENEVLQSVFMNKESDLENQPLYDSQPKVWSDAPIIEEYESDSEDEHVSLPIEEQDTPSFADQQVKTPRETVKNQFIHSKNPKVDKKGLGYGFTTKACFICRSLSHLIKDCDFHEKRMAKQVDLNKKKGKDNVQRENKPVWNNVQRVNHKNQFVPRAVLTKTSKIPVSTPRASGSDVGGKRETAVKPSADTGIVDSGCSRGTDMTGNKAILAEYQDFS
ncbi:ribonuclease H-like domain-containing protein [Tanacetum coccineum]